MKKIWLYLFLILSSSSIFAQTVLIYEGQTFTNTAADTWDGVNIPRNQPTAFTFRNNSVTSVNAMGYMLQAGDERQGGPNNNLAGEIISGNKFIWNGTDYTSITHGVFTGYNINAILKYNYLLNVPLGLLRKSDGMTNTAGGVSYNIVVNPKSGVVAKGMNNVRIYNNTFYSSKTPAESGRGIVDIYTNTDYPVNAPSTGTKVFNNIFYTKHRIFNIKIYDNSCLSGFESDYNIYWCEDGEPIFEVSGIQKTFTQWKAMGFDLHSVVLNPNFNDFVNFVPAVRLDYGTNLGSGWETGLAEDAVWGQSDPKTSVQNGTWQVGARIYSAQMIPVSVISVSGEGGSAIINNDDGTLHLSASVLPSNATDKTVTWQVVNGTGQATINSAGVLSAIDNGTVTAIATANDGSGTIGSLVVTISNQIIPVTGIIVSGTGGISRINNDNGILQLIAEVLPANATNKTITWSVLSGAGYASVSSSGLLTALDNGTVTIMARANDASGVSGTIPVVISNQYIPVTSLNISGSGGVTAITVNRGTLQLLADVLPSNATDKTLSWSIQSGAGFATVNSSGLLTAVNNGIVTVTATANDGSSIYGNIAITVSNQIISVDGITITGTGGVTSITADNGTLQLLAEVSPASATNKTVSWSIANGVGLATVNAAGLISAADNGTVTVRAAAIDGSGVYGTIVIEISNQVIPVGGISVAGSGGGTVINTNNGSLQLTANVSPANATNKNVIWTLVNGSGAAIINSSGLVTAIEDGTVTATADATDGSGISGAILITISNQIISIATINITGTGGLSSITSDNGFLQLIPVILPANATNKTLAWNIINGTGLATINSAGLLSAAENGSVTVKATAMDGTGVFGTITVTISNQIIPVSEIIVTGARGASIITSDIGTLQLNASISPATATNKTVTWYVINGTGAASISSTGLVTASASGTVTAVATASDGSNVTATLPITISPTIIPVSSVTVSGAGGITSISTDAGTLQLSESILPVNATDKSVQWSVVNNTGQAVISTSGLVTALANGTVTARATANDGSGEFGTMVITISNQIIPVSSISVSGTDGVNLISYDGGTLQLIEGILPVNATVKTVTWTVTNNSGRATINPSGLLTAISDGTVTARATANDGSGIYGSLTVTITNQVVDVTGISVSGAGGLSAISADKGALQLDAAILPIYATNQNITWSVTDGTGHATISSTGLLTAVNDGTVTARASANDGSGISGTLIVTITNQIIHVTGITVSGDGGSSISTDNGTLQLSALVVPANATDKAVVWSIVSGTESAIVSSSGIITAIDNGTITVMAMAHDGSGVYGTLAISISNQIVLVSSINVTGAGGLSAITADGGSLQMIADVFPSTAANKNIAWTLENNAGEAVINSTGHLTALENGTVRVRATAQDNSGVSGFADVIISNQVTPVTNITVSGAGGLSSIATDNGSLQLTAAVLPVNATDKSVSWTVITNPGLAAINSAGLLTAVNNGLVTVRASANDGSGATGTINITITNQIVPVSAIVVTGAANATIITQDNGSLQLTASVTPANANNKTVTWSLVNGTGQATISTSGLITAVSDGTVTVRATAADGSGVSGTLVISIFNQVIPVTGITVNGAAGATAITTDNGSLQMSASILPLNATNKNVTWSVSSGAGLAGITPSGLLTAFDNGTIVVRATAKDGTGISGSRTITISNQLGPVTSVVVTGAGGATSINVDDGLLQLSAAVFPSNSTIKTITWSFVNDLGLATINTNGLLTAVSNGTVTVKATANDGSGVSGTLVITITNQIVPVSLLSISGPGGLTAITENKGSMQLGCLIMPENATNKAVTWTIVNNTGEATINASGLVTAVANGTVTVHVIANDGSGISSSLLLTISGQIVPVTEVIVSTPGGITSITKNNRPLQLTASVLPANASIHTVTWTIAGGSGLASINATGLLTPMDNGIVTIKATANDGSGKYGTITIPILNQESDNLTIIVTRDEINVYLNDNYINWRAALYSFHGNLVIEKHVTSDILTLNISNQSSGMFLVVLSSGEKIRVAKVIKP